MLIAALLLLALKTAQAFPLTSEGIRSLLVRLIPCGFALDAHDGHMIQKCDDNFFFSYVHLVESRQ